MEKYLTEEEVSRLLSAPLDNTQKLLIQMGLETGMRVSEISGILARNINGNFIKIYDYKKNDWRTVVISDELARSLKTYVSTTVGNHRGPRKLFGITERTINNWLKEMFAQAQLPAGKAHWHTFRHTFVRRCQHLGYDASFAVAQTGDSPETILRYYGVPSLDDRLKELKSKPLYRNRDSSDFEVKGGTSDGND